MTPREMLSHSPLRPRIVLAYEAAWWRAITLEGWSVVLAAVGTVAILLGARCAL